MNFNSIVFLTTDRLAYTHSLFRFSLLSLSHSLRTSYVHTTGARICFAIAFTLRGGYVLYANCLKIVFSSTLFFVRVVCLVGRISSKTHRRRRWVAPILLKGICWNIRFFRIIARSRARHTRKIGMKWSVCFPIEIFKIICTFLPLFVLCSLCARLSSTSLQMLFNARQRTIEGIIINLLKTWILKRKSNFWSKLWFDLLDLTRKHFHV